MNAYSLTFFSISSSIAFSSFSPTFAFTSIHGTSSPSGPPAIFTKFVCGGKFPHSLQIAAGASSLAWHVAAF